MNDLIKKLVEAYGPSGFEDNMRELIRPEVEKYADEISVDAMGNLIARKKGSGGGLKVMIAAHMDEIGLMISHITEDGFCRFTNIGGIYPHTLLGSRVQFGDGRIGIIYSDRITDRSKIHGLDKHYIDVGASSKAACPVQGGDAVGFVRPFPSPWPHLVQLPNRCQKRPLRPGHHQTGARLRLNNRKLHPFTIVLQSFRMLILRKGDFWLFYRAVLVLTLTNNKAIHVQ